MRPVRFSYLKLMARSPAHYRDALRFPMQPTRAMRIGTVAHAGVLGAWKDVAVWRGGRRYGREWDGFVADRPDSEIVSVDEFEAGLDIARAVLSDPHAASLLDRALCHEEDIEFTIGDRDCGVRVDAYGDIVVELKTCADASPARFPYQAARMGYHAQLAWQVDALARTGIETSGAYIIAVESKPPHVVQCYEATPDAIDFGRRCYVTWFERLLQCEAADEWPGYVQSVVPLDPPDGAGDVSITIGDEEVTF